VWALAEDRDHILEILPATQRYRIVEAVNIFGLARAVEIGKSATRAPHIVDQVASVAKMLSHFNIKYEKRAIGEWLIAHAAQRWVREHTKWTPQLARKVAAYVNGNLKPGSHISASGPRALKKRGA
jgi:hypothetical protein